MRRPHFFAGFSLVEVTLALGVAGFCLITLFGLLPLGLQTNQNALSQTEAASVLSSIVTDLRATPMTSLISPQYQVTLGTETILYINDQGLSVSPTIPNAAPRYKVAVTFPANPIGGVAPTWAHVKVTWPALVDSDTTPPPSSLETFAVINRN